ncbi:MAG: hypothetical protein ACQEXO_10340, partial [Pseudomonadota bacterium]
SATASTTVVDDNDTTTVTLDDVTYLEGTNNATISAEIDNAPTSNLTVTVSMDGSYLTTITFLANSTATATSEPFEVPVTEHGAPGTSTDSALKFTVTGVVTSGGAEFEQLTVQGGSLTITDDVPESLVFDDPGATVLDDSNVSVNGDITFVSGADDSGGIIFSDQQDTTARDANGNPLFLNGEPLQLVGLGTESLSLQTADGTQAMLVTIDSDSQYTITPVSGIISTIQDLGAIDLSGFTGGNNDTYALVDAFSGSNIDVVLWSTANDNNGKNTVNTNSNLIGVGAGQDVDFDGTTGDVLNFQFQSDTTVSGSGGNTVINEGDLNPVTKVVVPFGAVSNNALIQWEVFSGGIGGTSVNSGSVTATQLAAQGGSITISANGSTFDTVSITAGSTDGTPASFKVGGFSITEVVQGDPIDLSFDVTGKDNDGDTIESSLNFTLSPKNVTPIALDLDNDGVDYLSLNAGVVFTDELTSQSVNTAWVGPEDGLLVIDANNSGTVDETREYVFTEWSETAETDMEAVREVFDTNSNGMLDPGDEAWSQFAVWQDANSDGKTDAGELVSLGELGVESIELNYGSDSEGRTDADGDVVVFGQSQVNWTDGSVTIAEDASFAITASEVLSEEADEDLFQEDGSSSHAKADASYSGEQADVPATGATSFEDLDTSNNSIE